MIATEKLSKFSKSALEYSLSPLLLVLWSLSLSYCLRLKTPDCSYALIAFAMLLRTFLHTGLFVITHDAIHGSAIPHNRFLNDRLGALAIGLYAFLPYEMLRKKHHLHHRYPASSQDPDYHEGDTSNPYLWYWRFMKAYLKGKQGLIAIFEILATYFILAGLGISMVNLLLFWLLPLVFSSMQLFYFGTYLPHRRTAVRDVTLHRATSSQLSVFWSLLSCYHFGYHWEHHAYPWLPWYALPTSRGQLSTAAEQSTRQVVGIEGHH
ncbi:MAG: fatty acid desaturase [Anaerolineae bacterium]|nr:fatty acid desaturase [Gloeobacterales cyanobacterium ES-bin-313]